MRHDRSIHHARRIVWKWLTFKGVSFGSHCPSNIELMEALLKAADCPDPVKEIKVSHKAIIRAAIFLIVPKGQKPKARPKIAQPKGRHGNFVTKSGDAFFDSDEWKALRYRVLRHYGAACQCCGRTRADGLKLHVDHIKPRSRFPELALEFSNLQVLCEDCNIGKGARDATDWRNPQAEADKLSFAELRDRGVLH